MLVEVTVVNLSQQSEESDSGVDRGSTARCKFVLVSVGQEHCFVFGPVQEFAYHANLINRFCSDRGIPTAWVRRPDRVQVYDKQVRLHGGGWMEINPQESTIRIWGHSSVYGRFDREILDLLIENDPFFALYYTGVEN